MKIETIELPKPHRRRWAVEKRCSRKVKSTGTSYFDNKKDQCGRLARYNIDGVPLCTQHSGEFALKHLIVKLNPVPSK